MALRRFERPFERGPLPSRHRAGQGAGKAQGSGWQGALVRALRAGSLQAIKPSASATETISSLSPSALLISAWLRRIARPLQRRETGFPAEGAGWLRGVISASWEVMRTDMQKRPLRTGETMFPAMPAPSSFHSTLMLQKSPVSTILVNRNILYHIIQEQHDSFVIAHSIQLHQITLFLQLNTQQV